MKSYEIISLQNQAKEDEPWIRRQKNAEKFFFSRIKVQKN